ncbi:MAG: glycosyltransferase, partial [Victivallaceae bacterium]
MYKIFVSGMAYDGGKSGISVYMYNVITSLAAAGHQLEILALDSDLEKMPQHRNISYLHVPAWLGKPAVNMLWHLCILPWSIKWKKYDFILLPAANRRALLFCRNYTLGVVHDLSQYHIECKYDAFRMFYIKRILPWAVRRMSHLVAVSGSTASDLEKYWHVPSSMITVNYNGYDRSRFFLDGNYIKGRGKDKFNLKKDYILYVSRIEYPGKNHLNLIKAYEQLPEAFHAQYDLV